MNALSNKLCSKNMVKFKVKAIKKALKTEGINIGEMVVYVILDGEDNPSTLAGSVFKKQKAKEMTAEQILAYIKLLKCRKVLIAGGEPLRNHRDMESLLLTLRNMYVIIETKGAVKPNDNLLKDVYGWHVMPELVSSEKIITDRINYDALLAFVDRTNQQIIFRVLTDYDFGEVLFLKDQLKIPTDRITLMSGETKARAIEKHNKKIKELCMEHGFNYSPRLQLID